MIVFQNDFIGISTAILLTLILCALCAPTTSPPKQVVKYIRRTNSRSCVNKQHEPEQNPVAVIRTYSASTIFYPGVTVMVNDDRTKQTYYFVRVIPP